MDRLSEQKHYPGCETSALERVHEQRAWKDYLQKQYVKGEDWMMLPCMETDGYPGSGSKCRGAFVWHYFWQKEKRKLGVVDAMVDAIGEVVR